MNFGFLILILANITNGYLLNSIPLEKLMQKALTNAAKRSQVYELNTGPLMLVTTLM